MELKFKSVECAKDNIALARRFFKIKFIKSCLIISLLETCLLISLINMEKSAKNVILLSLLMVLGVVGIAFMYLSQKKSEEYVMKNDKREYVSFEFLDSKIVGETKFSDNGEVITKDYDYRLIRSYKEDDCRIYLKIIYQTPQF